MSLVNMKPITVFALIIEYFEAHLWPFAILQFTVQRLSGLI
jgi:hypothetical protein